MIDSLGVQFVNIEGNLPTFSGVIPAYAPYATATDMCALQNPAASTAMLRLTQIRIAGVATAAAFADIYGQIRTALDTGGGITTVSTTARHDQTLGAAQQGLLVTFSSAPTLAGTVSTPRVSHQFLGVAATAAVLPEKIWQFGDRASQQIHLRPGQQFALNNNGAAVGAGTLLYVTFEWTESVFGSVPVF